MKFAKLLASNIEKYKVDVAPELWFSYKIYKKRLKVLATKYAEVIAKRKTLCIEDESIDYECCVCLEPNNLMKTFCCHNYIHHACLVHTLAFTNSLCPLCRNSIENVIKCDKNKVEECLDTEILSLISYIHMEFMKISSDTQKISS